MNDKANSQPRAGEITGLLQAWSNGQDDAQELLWPLVYEELHEKASQFMRSERQDHTLQVTAVVHEAYLKLVDQRKARWQDRNHFYAIAARVMRRILVDHARKRACSKRWGDQQRREIDSGCGLPPEAPPDLVALDEALATLKKLDHRKANIVELKFFGGLTYSEIGEVLHCSEKTVQRQWKFARAWLLRELSEAEDHRS